MPYTARVIDKQIVNGLLRVTIEYSDGNAVLVERMETRCAQDADWLQKETTRRCMEIDGLISFSETVKVGQIDTDIGATNVEVIDAGRAAYKDDLQDFNRYLMALRQGIVTVDRAEFVTLRDKLKANFKPEYLDLFMGWT